MTDMGSRSAMAQLRFDARLPSCGSSTRMDAEPGGPGAPRAGRCWKCARPAPRTILRHRTFHR